MCRESDLTECLTGAMSVTDLEAQQVNLLKVVDSPLIPTEQPPADAHKPAAIKATEVEIDAGDLLYWFTLIMHHNAVFPRICYSLGFFLALLQLVIFTSCLLHR